MKILTTLKGNVYLNMEQLPVAVEAALAGIKSNVPEALCTEIQNAVIYIGTVAHKVCTVIVDFFERAGKNQNHCEQKLNRIIESLNVRQQALRQELEEIRRGRFQLQVTYAIELAARRRAIQQLLPLVRNMAAA